MGDPAGTVAIGAEPAPIDVLIVDDQVPFLSAARMVIGATPGFRVVGEAGSGEAALELAGRLQPAVVLMDINLPGISGIEATRRLLADEPDTRVALLSTYTAADLPEEARTCGARAYVNKEDLVPDTLVALVEGTLPSGF